MSKITTDANTQPLTDGETALQNAERDVARLPRRQGGPQTQSVRATVSLQQAPERVLHGILGHLLSRRDFKVDVAHYPPVELSHVCRYWRNCFLNEPRYWNRICFTTPKMPIKIYKHQEVTVADILRWRARLGRIWDAASAFITRSGRSALEMTVDMQPCVHCPQCMPLGALLILRGIMEGLCSVSDRWANCTFNIPSCDCIKVALEPILILEAGDVPWLTRLRWRDRVVFPWKKGGICLELSLQSLSIDRSYNMRPWGDLSIKWSTLTELYYDGFTKIIRNADGDEEGRACFDVRSALALLKNCTSLIKCSLTISENDSGTSKPSHGDTEEDWQSPIELKHLRSLTINGKLPSGRFLDVICLPSLRELCLMDTVACTPDNMWLWMGRFGEGLTSLTMDMKDLSSEDITQLLKSVHNLRELDVCIKRGSYGMRGGGEQLLDSLTCEFGDNGGLDKMCLCPDLRRFICFQHSCAFTVKDLDHFMECRRSPFASRHGISLIEFVEVEFSTGDRLWVRRSFLPDEVGYEPLEVDITTNYI